MKLEVAFEFEAKVSGTGLLESNFSFPEFVVKLVVNLTEPKL